MLLDTGLETLGPHPGARYLIGCLVKPSPIALAAGALKVDVCPGFLVIDDHVAYFEGSAELAINDGNTLSASSEIYSAVVAYFNEAVNAPFILVVDGDEATTASGDAAAPSDADIEAALPNSAYPWTRLGVVKFSTDAGSLVTFEEIDSRGRWFGVDPDKKPIASGNVTEPIGDAAVYRPHSILAFTVDAADIADGDLLTDRPLPMIYGKIKRWRAVVEKAITTAAKTTTPQLEIGTALVTGTDGTAFAGVHALGAVTTLGAPTGANTFKPGDNLSIVAGTTTAFVEGRVRFEVEIEEQVFY